MTKDVALGDLQEHLAEHIEEVKLGTTLRVIDRGETVAALMPPETVAQPPLDDMVIRPATGRFGDFTPPPPIESEVDFLALLREDRDSR